MIHSRQVEDVAKLLKKFTKATKVTRDGAPLYRSAIDIALPTAIQISDRYHLISGLAEALDKDIKFNFNYFIIKALRPKDIGDKSLKETILETKHTEKIYKPELPKKARTTPRLKKILEVIADYNESKSYRDTAKKFGICKDTVGMYVNKQYNAIITKEIPSPLDKYHQLIGELCFQKKNNKEIHILLEEQGYSGKAGSVRNYIVKHNLRNFKGRDFRYNKIEIPRSKLISLLYNKGLTDLKLCSQDIELMKIFIKENSLARLILQISLDFRIILFSKDPDRLDQWLSKYQGIEKLSNLQTFIGGATKDCDAVKNAITNDESNGRTEGIVNKIKTKKRVMYGRCKFGTLKAYFFNAQST